MPPQEIDPESREYERLPADEAAPLLGEEPQGLTRSPFTQPISVLNVAVYVAYLMVLELGQTLPANAFHQVVEENLCSAMHGRTDAGFCGAADDVQSSLAVQMGWYGTAQFVPGLLCAIPYALLADRHGQKPFIVLNAFGTAIAAAVARIICFWPNTFSVYYIWTAPLLNFVGGGLNVSNALLFANITGLTSDASRASIISVLIALSYGPRLVATVASSKLLELYGPWLLLWTSLVFAFLGVFLACFLVEPKSKKASDDLLASDSGASDAGEETVASGKVQLRAKLRQSFEKTKEGFAYLLKKCDAHVIRVALCLVIMTIAWRTNLDSEIMRRKFGWTWAELSYLTAGQIIVTLVSSMILIPGASYIMTTKFGLNTVTRDLTIARACGVLFLLGGSLIILSPTGVVLFIALGAIIWHTGTVYNMVFRNLLVLAVGENSVMLFSCINTVETIGTLLMTPIIAQVFKLGLHLGGVRMAPPVMVGCGFAAGGLLLLGVKNDYQSR